MKKITSCCLTILSLSIGNIYSQKIDLDKEMWTHSYVRLPRSKDLSNLNTYSINMFTSMDNLNKVGLTPDKIESMFKLDGYVYSTGQADISMEVTIESLKKISEEVRTQESTVYEGGKNVVKKTYIPATSYSIPTIIKITKSSNEELMNSKIGSDQNPVVIGSGEFSTFEEANAQFKGSEEKRLESFKEKYYSMLTAELNSWKERYDFSISKESDVYWHVDLKKNPEYSEFNEKLTTAKGIFANLKASDDLKEMREKLGPTMQYLRENADKVTGDDKKNKKLKYAYLLNLGKIQLWLELLDESAATAQQVIDNDYDKSDGKTLLRSVNSLKEELKNSPNGSRYLARNGFTSPTHFSVSEIKPIQPKTSPSATTTAAGILAAVLPAKHKNASEAKPVHTEERVEPVVQTEDEIKKGLGIVFTFFKADYLLGDALIIPGEFVYDQSKKLIGQKFIWSIFPDRQKITNEGVLSINYYNNKISGTSLAIGCERYNDSFYNFEIVYNDQNMISKILQPWANFGSSKKPKLIRNSYEITYDGNRMVKVVKNEIAGEGDIKNPKVVKETQDRYVTVVWKNDSEATISRFGKIRNPKQQEVIGFTGKLTLRVNAGSSFSETEGIDNSKNSREIQVTGNQVIITSKAGSSVKEVTTYSLDEYGRVIKVVETESQMKKTSETTVSYVLKEAGLAADNLCNYKTKNFTSQFDSAGNVISESSDVGIRTRNPDGTWGPWKSFTY